MIRIYLTNLGKYNEGFLIGEWLELPATDKEIADVLERIGVSDEPDENGNYYEEYFITDYETDVDGLRIGEYDNLDDLNDLAEVLDGNEEAAAALIYYGYDTAEEIRDNLDNVIYICKCGMFETEESAIGWYYAKELGSLDIPENVEPYFDFEAYGSDIMLEGNFYVTENHEIYEVVA